MNNDYATADPWTFVDNNGGLWRVLCPSAFYAFGRMLLNNMNWCNLFHYIQCCNEYYHGYTYSFSVKWVNVGDYFRTVHPYLDKIVQNYA